ncbi:MAG TPA: AI-2E family transporter, partial [Gaiellales bacterium]|nr:AI-2E family transporter [Gaiellales bacterium]
VVPQHSHRGEQPVDGVPTPYVLRFSAAWAWRLLLVIAAVWVVLQVFGLLSVVLVPVIIGLLFSAALSPLADRLQSWRVPRGPATVLVVIAGIAFIAALVALVTQQFSNGFGDLRASFDDSLVKLETYLRHLGLSHQQLTDFFDKVRTGVSSGSQGDLGGTVVRATTTAGHLLAGLFITLFATIFFTYDGRGIWRWLVSLFPATAQERVDGSGVRAWAVLTSYVRATFVIAVTDALGIALVALILQLPLVLPLAVLVFIGAFIPVVGAAISGIAAVAVALVDKGPVTALLMLAGVVAVQQIEGHVLQPFLMGRLVRVHPLAVVVVIAIGAEVAGIFGALIAVPLTAIINTVSTYLAGSRRQRLADDEAGALTDNAVTP